MPVTPDQVLSEIHRVRAALAQGADVLHDAEIAKEKAADEAQFVTDVTFLEASGSIPERQAQARLAARDARDAAHVAAAAWSRTRARIRALESELMSLQSELKWMTQEGA